MQNEHIRLIISEQAGLILTKYSAWIDIWVGINLSLVLRSLYGFCYGNQLIWGFLPDFYTM